MDDRQVSNWVTTRPDGAAGFKFRFYVDQKPSNIILRRGTSRYARWQVCAELGGDAGTLVLHAQPSKKRAIMVTRVLITTGITALLDAQAQAVLKKL